MSCPSTLFCGLMPNFELLGFLRYGAYRALRHEPDAPISCVQIEHSLKSRPPPVFPHNRSDTHIACVRCVTSCTYTRPLICGTRCMMPSPAQPARLQDAVHSTYAITLLDRRQMTRQLEILTLDARGVSSASVCSTTCRKHSHPPNQQHVSQPLPSELLPYVAPSPSRRSQCINISTEMVDV
jgi:hypothetical protein